MDDSNSTVDRASPGMDDHRLLTLSILGGVLLCTLIAGLLGDSLLGVFARAEGEPIPRGWQWLLGVSEQTFGTQTMALLLGVLLLGFALGGCWFLVGVALRRFWQKHV